MMPLPSAAQIEYVTFQNAAQSDGKTHFQRVLHSCRTEMETRGPRAEHFRRHKNAHSLVVLPATLPANVATTSTTQHITMILSIFMSAQAAKMGSRARRRRLHSANNPMFDACIFHFH